METVIGLLLGALVSCMLLFKTDTQLARILEGASIHRKLGHGAVREFRQALGSPRYRIAYGISLMVFATWGVTVVIWPELIWPIAVVGFAILLLIGFDRARLFYRVRQRHLAE